MRCPISMCRDAAHWATVSVSKEATETGDVWVTSQHLFANYCTSSSQPLTGVRQATNAPREVSSRDRQP